MEKWRVSQAVNSVHSLSLNYIKKEAISKYKIDHDKC